MRRNTNSMPNAIQTIGLVVLFIFTGIARAQPTPKWTVTPDPLPKPAKIAPTFNFVVPTRFGFGDVVVSPQNPAAIAFNNNNITTNDWESWDLATRKRIGAIKGAPFDKAMLSPDGLHLVVAEMNNDGVAEVWSLQTGKLVHKLPNNQKVSLTLVGFAVNDQLVTVASQNFRHYITAWSLKTGQPAFTVEEDRWLFANAAVSPGGRYVAYPAKGDVIKIHDLSTNKPAAELTPPHQEGANVRADNNVRAVAFSPDGTTIAVRYEHSPAHRLAVWDLATGNVALNVQVPEARDLSAKGPEFQWLADGSGIVVGLQLLDRQSGGLLHTFEALDSAVAHRQYLSLYSVLYVSKPQQNKMIVRAVALPKNDIDKALAAVRAGGKAVDVDLPRLAKADWSAVKEIPMKAGPLKAPLPPDVAQKFTKKLAPLISFRKINDPDNQTEQAVTGVYFSSPAIAQALVPHDIGPKMRTFTTGQPLQKVWADRVDLATGKVMATYEFPNVARVLDMNLDATHAAVALSDRIDLYALNPSLKHVVGFRPYEKDEGDGKYVRWARLLDAEHLLTVNHVGNIHTGARLVLWKLPECKAIYSVKLAAWTTPAASPNRKHLAVPVDAGMLLLDGRTGNAHGILPMRRNSRTVLSFSLDGTLLAACDQSGQASVLYLWDLRKPTQPESAIALPARRASGFTLDWASPGYLLANNFLIDLEKRMIVWDYVAPSVQSNLAEIGDVDEATWFLSPAGGLKLASSTLPHDEARKTLAALKPEDYSVRPGLQVSLDPQTATGDAEVQKKLIADLTQRLTANGLTVAENQPLRLVTQVTTRPGKEIQYNRVGTFEKAKASTTEYDARIAFELNGQPVWEAKTTGTNADFFVQMKQGETPQDVLTRSIPQLGVNFFTSVPLPKYAPKPGAGPGFGRSELTVQGAKPAVAPPAPPRR